MPQAALLGSVEKSQSGIAAGLLNATKQTGSVIGVALFGSIIGVPHMFMPGMREVLLIPIALLLRSALIILLAGQERFQRFLRDNLRRIG